MSEKLGYVKEPIAIIGSACRFPGGSTTPSKFWDLLQKPRDLSTAIPDSRFTTAGVHNIDPLHHGTTNVQHSYLLEENIRLFDAHFFGIKAVEAISVDPQQRLLLETVYEGLESAGVPLEKLQGSQTGVWVGLMCGDYAELLGRDVDTLPTYYGTGTARSIISNRISYFFDWHGPSMTIDTACSSSLIALHQAVQSLRLGEVPAAVVAGSNLLLSPGMYVAESKLKMLSPHGRSRMWDKAADGYARGDGVGALVLKTLSQALRDGDHIECLVRETGTNQDGRTKGITMPSSVAQTALIRDTYNKAGLDLSKSIDRPQYFEAHGTGTPAGDPIEAEAISTAFFSNESGYRRDPSAAPLYVGSAKTVIGHTEGTAGIAGVIKASLALQNGTIPPNLHLDQLNPAVAPFYGNLKIPQEAQEWPQLPDGGTRRASVNSFGFGGANAHAILESYAKPESASSSDSFPHLGPFNFSASSEKSLLSLVAAYSEYLKTNSSVSLRDLSFTLNVRRSTLPVRVSVAAATSEALLSKLDDFLYNPKGIVKASSSGSANANGQPKLLGVFTGQGAQWPSMGAKLIKTSGAAAEMLRKLQHSLDELPEDYRPKWTLKDELLKDKDSSRIGEGAISQPLCAAVQIVLITLLEAANVRFSSVIGHSSGEIVAAFAAGYLSAEDAIRVAYLRGFFLHLAKGPESSPKGGMLAAGTTYEDAEGLVELESLKGRVVIAASNSPESVTLSGDLDAIQEAKDILDDEGKFARLLKVDSAYHSHHMFAASQPYIDALTKANVQVKQPPSTEGYPVWTSSVLEEDVDFNKHHDILGAEYWSKNMVSPVLFSQALEYAVGAHGPFDLAVEVGPHPALKSPATTTIQASTGQSLSYTGVLRRGVDDAEAFAESLGYVWQSLGRKAVDFTGLELRGHAHHREAPAPSLLKSLPTYPWEHDREYWHESRFSKALRNNPQSPHVLLGSRVPDGTRNEFRWRNYLNIREVPWLVHHQIQGQIIFPAAGYLSAAVEAVVQLYGLESVQLVEFAHISIGQALVLNEDASSVETLLSYSVTKDEQDVVEGFFRFHSETPAKATSELALNASGRLIVRLGPRDESALPPPSKLKGSFLEIDSERFYEKTDDLGFGYSGPFRKLTQVSRKMDEAIGKIQTPDLEDQGEVPLIVHPGTLDSAIQSTMLAFCYPGDGRLRSIYLPTGIDRLRINPAAYAQLKGGPGSLLSFHATVESDRPADLRGDFEVHSDDDSVTLIQLEGLSTTPLIPISAENDLDLFTEMTWAPESPTGNAALEGSLADDQAMALDMERVAYYYMRQVDAVVAKKDRGNLEWHHQAFYRYFDHNLEWVAKGTHPFVKSEWVSDTSDKINAIFDRYPESVDLRLMKVVGENLPGAVRNELNILEAMFKDNLLNEFYATGFGMQRYLADAARIVGEISHRFPHQNIIELGAGTGSATYEVLKEIKGAFSSYTYTDIPAASSSKLKRDLKNTSHDLSSRFLTLRKMLKSRPLFRTLASLILHATKNLETTMRNARRLLKPNGRLIMVEVTDNDPLRLGLIFAGLPGLWLGQEKNRKLSPCVSAEEWEVVMKKTGFSGIETITPHSRSYPLPLSVIVFQAADSDAPQLYTPLSPSVSPLGLGHLSIIGGASPRTSAIAQAIEDTVKSQYSQITRLKTLEDVTTQQLPLLGSVVSLVDLEETPLFKDVTSEKLAALRELFKQSKVVLWASQGSAADTPYRNMYRGLERSIKIEMTHLQSQILDIDKAEDVTSDMIAGRLIRLETLVSLEQSGRLRDFVEYLEPELRVRNGIVHVPRIKRSTQRNRRYNSGRRPISQDISIDESRISIHHDGSKHSVEFEHVLDSNPSSVLVPHQQTAVSLSYSLTRPVLLSPRTSLYVSVGHDAGSRSPVIVLSENLASTVSTEQHLVSPVTGQVSPQTLLDAYTRLIALRLIHHVSPGDTIVVLNPGHALGAAISKLAVERWANVVLFTSNESREILSKPWQYLHPLSTRNAVKKLLPSAVKLFIDVGKQTSLSSVVRRALPNDTSIVQEAWLDPVAGPDSNAALDTAETPAVSTLLKAALLPSSATFVPLDSDLLPSVTLGDIASRSVSPSEQTLLTWPDASTEIPVPVQPAGKVTKFAKDRTYWLVGLTGGLGLSLCEWMARHGAGHIVLSSRNPKLDQEWLQSMADLGCNIRAFSNDITNREAVRDLHHLIVKTSPPIAGVAQGAMVLDDAMFPDLDIDKLHRVSRPKVEGSVWLDEIFSENTLDWFIFFSSITYVTGNAGQSAYAASNGFMTSLAEERRRRGLAGSAMNIGVIMGNGYVSRELTIEQQTYLHRVGHWWMSEQDFHQIFAECVLASRPNSPDSPEFITGLRLDEDDEKNWIENPIFQHLVIKSVSSKITSAKGKGGAMIKAQLLEAASHEQVFDIIKDGLVHKLQVALQADRSKLLLDSSPDELGVDSLVAVDIRSWFLKEPGVDMPVLKILNSSSVRDLVVSAQDLLSASAIPNVVADGQTSTQAPTAPVEASYKEPIVRVDSQLESEILKPTDISLPGSKTDVAETVQTVTVTASASSVASGSIPTSPTSSGLDNPSQLPESQLNGIDFAEPEILRTLSVSFGQSRFWFLKHFVSDQTAFNITTVIKLRGTIDKDALAQAVVAVGQRHEALRTAFFTDQETNEHKQAILSQAVLQLELKNIADETEVESAKQDLKNHVYDLSRGESIRIQLLSTTESAHWLLLGYHHINMDGVGYLILLSDLEKAYRGRLNVSPDNVLQYPDFTVRQSNEYASGAWDKELSFWKNEFSQLPEPLPLLLPSKLNQRPQTTNLGANEVTFRLPRKTVEAINKVCLRFKVTPFQFHLSIFSVLLFRYTGGHEDITIGVADANRKEVDQLNALGIYLNLLPLRLRRTAKETFATVLRKVQSSVEGAFVNSRVPFDVILGELNVPRQPSHTPLFQAFLNYRQNIQEAREVFGAQGELDIISAGQNNYDISIDILENSKTVENFITISVQKSLYSQEAAEGFKNSYSWLLQQFVENPATRTTWPSLYPKEAVEEVVNSARGVDLDLTYLTLVHRIDDMVGKFANQTALKDLDGRTLTYQDLQQHVSSVSHELDKVGVASGDRVGVFQTAGVDWIISLLAILRIGATYVPFDPKVGTDRLLLVAQDSQPAVFLVTSSTEGLDFARKQSVSLINVSNLVLKPGHDNFPVRAQSTDSAIIMYTSGSTGTPKGITSTHENWNNWVEATPATWGVREGQEVGLQQSSYTFDMSLLQIFTILGRGGALVIPSSDARHDPFELFRLVTEEHITFTCCTPTEYLAWLRIADGKTLQESSWRLAVTGGEAISDQVVHAFKNLNKSDLQLFNCYGPTETTIGCGDALIPYHQVSETADSESRVPPDTNAQLLSEVVIGGAGVSNGYLHNEELTAEKFIPDMYASSHFAINGWDRVHRSGDRGQLTKDGKLILLGRVDGDTQVKIGGIRMDLVDIETIIARYSSNIHKAVVSARKSQGSDHRFLVAFLVFADYVPAKDRTRLLQEIPTKLPLPQYMRPAVAIEAESLPTTSAGKLDRRKLDLIPIPSHTETQAPLSETSSTRKLTDIEQTLRGLWLEVLPSELAAQRGTTIDSLSDFFHVGGSSLSLITLQGLIREKLGIPVALSSLFESSSLGQMAQSLAEQADPAQEDEIEWEDETALDPADLALDLAVDPPSGTPSIVVLTGATGFIGRAVLRQLVEDPRIAKVYCLAVRRKVASRETKLFRHNKVVLFSGDLGSPRLGLTKNQAESVFISAEAVIHAGADVSFMKSYRSLKLMNVSSVKELVRLSAPHRLPLHFVSSAGVARLSGLDTFGPQSIAPFPPPRSNPEGYIAAKYVSEVYLEKAARALGFSLWIHRPSSVVGDDPNNLDLMSNMLDYAKKVKAVAASDGWRGQFDFISVEKTALSIVDEVVANNSAPMERADDIPNVRYIYQAGETVVPMSELKDFLEKTSGETFDVLPLDEWVRRAEDAGLSPLLATYLRQASAAQVVLPRLSNE
ncbi:hypothetical protein ACHAPJ_011772 [Fusarium lateritium]